MAVPQSPIVVAEREMHGSGDGSLVLTLRRHEPRQAREQRFGLFGHLLLHLREHRFRLFEVVEDDPKMPKRVLTVRGSGYVFARKQDAKE